jgi:hypothetical protein
MVFIFIAVFSFRVSFAAKKYQQVENAGRSRWPTGRSL